MFNARSYWKHHTADLESSWAWKPGNKPSQVFGVRVETSTYEHELVPLVVRTFVREQGAIVRRGEGIAVLVLFDLAALWCGDLRDKEAT